MDFQLTSSSIKRLLYLAFVISSAFYIKSYFHYSPQIYWLVWTALIFSLITVGDTFKRRIEIITAAGLIASFSVFIASNLSWYLPLSAAYLSLITLSCVYMSQAYPKFFFPIFIINIFTILSAGMAISLVESVDRVMWMNVGLLIALFYQLLFYPYFIQNEIRAYFILALQKLKKLNTDIFACLLEPEYPDNHYLYEHRIHKQKNCFMVVMLRLREMDNILHKKISSNEKVAHEERLDQLDLLFDNMLDYSQIRRRVTDYSTFSVCSQELKAIAIEINQAIDGAIASMGNKKLYINTESLNQKIIQLEASYHNVLQIASREPLTFLLFIDSLVAFRKNLDEFNILPPLVFTSFS